jgi:hypothetical protein
MDQLAGGKAYQSAGIGAIDAEKGDGRFRARGGGRGIASGPGCAGSNGSAGSAGAQSGGESPAGVHGGRGGDGLGRWEGLRGRMSWMDGC